MEGFNPQYHLFYKALQEKITFLGLPTKLGYIFVGVSLLVLVGIGLFKSVWYFYLIYFIFTGSIWFIAKSFFGQDPVKWLLVTINFFIPKRLYPFGLIKEEIAPLESAFKGRKINGILADDLLIPVGQQKKLQYQLFKKTEDN